MLTIVVSSTVQMIVVAAGYVVVRLIYELLGDDVDLLRCGLSSRFMFTLLEEALLQTNEIHCVLKPRCQYSNDVFIRHGRGR